LKSNGPKKKNLILLFFVSKYLNQELPGASQILEGKILRSLQELPEAFQFYYISSLPNPSVKFYYISSLPNPSVKFYYISSLPNPSVKFYYISSFPNPSGWKERSSGAA